MLNDAKTISTPIGCIIKTRAPSNHKSNRMKLIAPYSSYFNLKEDLPFMEYLRTASLLRKKEKPSSSDTNVSVID
jgi:hypothetical protein